MERADWLWNTLRPRYDWLVSHIARKGLVRTINGVDEIRVHPRFRQMGEVLEPEVWKCLMNEVKEGDIVADIGANIGLYTIALAKRVGLRGRVYAFEPDPFFFRALKGHVELNRVSDRVELIQAAVSERDGSIYFEISHSTESRIRKIPTPETCLVDSVTLDRMFLETGVDLIKIDVEGYEEKVLEGASNLLRDPSRSPRHLYIEVHPYAWPEIGTTSESLLKLLNECHYRVLDPQGKPVESIKFWGEVVAHRD